MLKETLLSINAKSSTVAERQKRCQSYFASHQVYSYLVESEVEAEVGAEVEAEVEAEAEGWAGIHWAVGSGPSHCNNHRNLEKKSSSGSEIIVKKCLNLRNKKKDILAQFV